MKNVMLGIGLVMICVMTFAISITVSGRMTRQTQSDTSVGQAIEDAVIQTMMQREYTIDDNREFVSEFLQNFLPRITSDADVEVQIMGIDPEEGLLSLRVILHYTNPNNAEGEEEYETTVVFSEEVLNVHLCDVTYLAAEDIIFSTYGIEEGRDFVIPTNVPNMDGKTFSYWLDTDTGAKAEFPEKVTTDKTYLAVYL